MVASTERAPQPRKAGKLDLVIALAFATQSAESAAITSPRGSLNQNEMDVLLRLVLRRGPNGRCDPSLQTIADDVGISRSKVAKIMLSLIGKGYIQRARRNGRACGNTSSAYTILWGAPGWVELAPLRGEVPGGLVSHGDQGESPTETQSSKTEMARPGSTTRPTPKAPAPAVACTGPPAPANDTLPLQHVAHASTLATTLDLAIARWLPALSKPLRAAPAPLWALGDVAAMRGLSEGHMMAAVKAAQQLSSPGIADVGELIWRVKPSPEQIVTLARTAMWMRQADLEGVGEPDAEDPPASVNGSRDVTSGTVFTLPF